MRKICVIPNFVKIVGAVHENVNTYLYTILARFIISGYNVTVFIKFDASFIFYV